MAVGAPAAHAGQYHVYSCRTPSGESAPADGWSGSKTGAYSYAEDTCAQQGGALVAALRNAPRTANTDAATWAFAAAVGETIAAATLWRAGDADGGAAINATYQFWLAGPKETEIFDECLYVLACPSQGSGAPPLGSQNRISVPSASLGGHLYVSASCGGVSEYKCPEGKADPNGYAAAVYLYAADITLEQSAGPTVANVSGELASAPTVAGTRDLVFSATDPGSGVYQAVFDVDGQVVHRTVVDENGGHCKDVGQTSDGLPAFLSVQPCAQSVSADAGFDTASVGNGAHHLIVSVIDAAGNAATVLDREITVANPPSPCAPGSAGGSDVSPVGKLSVAWKRGRSERITSVYGRAQTVLGRLTASDGAPIAGASVEAVATPALPGASAIALASPRTGPDGRFSLRVPGDVTSRRLCFAYRGPGGAQQDAATRTLTLNVRAGINLRVAPRTASIGREIRFSGRLLGRPIPPDGKQLVLEARSSGAPWLKFDVVRTSANGRYRASYRFKFPGPAEYQFRVVSEAESDYPYARGASNVVRVFER